MSNLEKFSKFHTRNSRLRRGSIYLGLAAALSLGAAACGEDEKWETVQQTEFTKGVRTTIEENAQGKFEIVNEEIVTDTSMSKFIIKYKDGRLDSLNLASARALLAGVPADTNLAKSSVNQPQAQSGGSSLSNILWWGAGGYLLGRALSSPSMNGFYSQRYYQQQPPAYGGGAYGGRGRADSARRNSRTRTGSSYRSSTAASDQLRSTTTTRTVSRPVSGGRSGFFGGSSRSSGG
jgi:hypothetical protein